MDEFERTSKAIVCALGLSFGIAIAVAGAVMFALLYLL